MNSTAFHIDVDKERENGYLVTHTNESRKYAWYQHSFKVFANVEAGVFECECRTWEHTGMCDSQSSNKIFSIFVDMK
ncbi:hypothetical protein PR202_ga01941 [Eleusine coracana subsp. coracana]|uniref:Uncharacterized protein n=1 Tax=Eleusine coracana subsp. coracana TaxID=191504 RepID=A0AAV5BJJ6_ELECO|nr:hypothetical protein PR202_ga01254 [Eleusine coracana subsp. coracana]GJM86117.1 hypothetical protein PR202_ga01941 [Eleusine coracana subsp. coracana]